MYKQKNTEIIHGFSKFQLIGKDKAQEHIRDDTISSLIMYINTLSFTGTVNYPLLLERRFSLGFWDTIFSSFSS